MIVASKPDVRFKDDQIILSVEVEGSQLPNCLWFAFPSSYEDYIDTESADWVLVALLLPAMAQGKALKVAGRLSPLLYHSVRSDLQHILTIQNPSLKRIEIVADKLVTKLEKLNDCVGTGFSAGVDSFASLALSNDGHAKKISHLTTFNVGAMGGGSSAREILRRYSLRLDEYCSLKGYQPLVVDSNIADFFDNRALGFQKTHTLRGAAAILPLQSLFGTYYYSSSFEYDQIKVKKSHDISFSDPIILPLLSTEKTQFRALGTQFSRLEKVKLVAEFQDSYDSLDVCVEDSQIRAKRKTPNCSKCWKCGRQLLSLELLGKLSAYKNSFDLEVYYQNRRSIIYDLCMRAFAGDRPNDVDVLRFAKSLGWGAELNLDLLLRISAISWKLRSLMSHYISRRLCKRF